MSRTDLKHVVPLVTESRLARQYAAIRERVPAVPQARRAWTARAGWGVAALAVAALAVVVHTQRARTAGLVDEAVIESSATTSVTLADGSTVDLGTSTRARLTSAKASAIRIDLERGSVDIEATHVEGRTFIVGAGPYEVHVVGTHFAVRRDPGVQVSVQVSRGAVEVTAVGSAGEARRLAAGEQWSAAENATSPAPAAVLAPPPPVSAPLTPAPMAAAPAPAEPGPAVVVGAAPRHDETARDLFDDAQRARAEGRPSDAARSFDRLRRTFPRDPRAALSAFELGRLRLDALGDPRGAEEALRDAIALGPSSPFREDAEARRVEALRRSGDANGCAAARSAYLARWPNGTYRRAVEVGCGD